MESKNIGTEFNENKQNLISKYLAKDTKIKVIYRETYELSTDEKYKVIVKFGNFLECDDDIIVCAFLNSDKKFFIKNDKLISISEVREHDE